MCSFITLLYNYNRLKYKIEKKENNKILASTNLRRVVIFYFPVSLETLKEHQLLSHSMATAQHRDSRKMVQQTGTIRIDLANRSLLYGTLKYKRTLNSPSKS